MNLRDFQVDVRDVLSDTDVKSFLWRHFGEESFDFESFALVCEEEQAKAMKIFPYPCIASYSFLTTRICKNPFYQSVLSAIAGKRLLDIGCCIGSDVRRMITDGAAVEDIVGVDLEEGYFEVGFNLFNDRERLGPVFVRGDFSKEGEFLKQIFNRQSSTEKGFDIVCLNSILHLLPEERIKMLLQLIFAKILPSSGPGILIGQTVGLENAGLATKKDMGCLQYLHSRESLKALLTEVGFVEVSIEHHSIPYYDNTECGKIMLFFIAKKL